MKKIICISLAVITILMAFTAPGHAEKFQRVGSGGRAEHFHGGGWGWAPLLGLGLGLGLWELTRPHYVYPYYPYYNQVPVITLQPPAEIYVQPNPQEPVEPDYWYYCPAPGGYYPYVQQCPAGWMKVVPSPPPPQNRVITPP